MRETLNPRTISLMRIISLPCLWAFLVVPISTTAEIFGSDHYEFQSRPDLLPSGAPFSEQMPPANVTARRDAGHLNPFEPEVPQAIAVSALSVASVGMDRNGYFLVPIDKEILPRAVATEKGSITFESILMSRVGGLMADAGHSWPHIRLSPSHDRILKHLRLNLYRADRLDS